MGGTKKENMYCVRIRFWNEFCTMIDEESGLVIKYFVLFPVSSVWLRLSTGCRYVKNSEAQIKSVEMWE